MVKVLITGVSGYLGRHLTKYIKNLGWEIYESNTKIGNLMDEKNLHIYNDIKFDYIFHLAAHTKAGDYCLHHKADQFEMNQQINSNILKYWRNHQQQSKIIAMGTSCSYSPDLLMCEENYLVGQPEESLYTYAMTKRMLLVGLKAYADQYGLKYMYYVPSTLYGSDFELDDTHFIFDLIKKIYSGKHKGTKVELWGDGYQKRELIFISDVIKIIFNTLHLENKVLNLGSGDEHTIREFAESVSKILGYQSDKISYDTSKYVGVKSKSLNTDEIFKIMEKVLPNFDFTKLEDGLSETINYYNKKQNEQ
jgi:GDP-L-fucose synthase